VKYELGCYIPDSVLGPILYLLYTSDLPTLEQNVVATFADDIAIMVIGDNNK
jgi:hypothetical protein